MTTKLFVRTTMKIRAFIRAEVPEEQLNRFLQHIRDFDMANEGCHFEVMADASDMPLTDMIDQLQVNPQLTFIRVLKREAE